MSQMPDVYIFCYLEGDDENVYCPFQNSANDHSGSASHEWLRTTA